jgi:hypothetical protein
MESPELVYCVFGGLVLPPPTSLIAFELSNLAVIQLVRISLVLDVTFSTGLECSLQVLPSPRVISPTTLERSLHALTWSCSIRVLSY